MKALYTQKPVMRKLTEAFSAIFPEETNPTKQHLFHLLLSVLTLNGFQSVQFQFDHFMKISSNFKLKSYYYTLNESKIDIDSWMCALIRIALSVMPEKNSSQPIILSIDDTMIEKSGKKFEHCEILFDHAAHNGSLYLNGHCFVSLMVSVPVQDGDKIRYLSVPVGYRMWTKEKSKLAIAAELVQKAMEEIGSGRQVCLCCDSWYPKGEILNLPEQFANLTLICNVRHDTVLYDLPPASTHHRGRPRIRGEKISLADFACKPIKGTDFYAGSRMVITNLFGKRRIYAIVTQSKTGSRRLFLCTKPPESLSFDPNCSNIGKQQNYAQTDSALLPLTIYALRWHIEIAYYEQKKFWSLGKYMLRSKTGIERLTNLLTILYAFMTLLPYCDSFFADLSDKSPQESRFLLGLQLLSEIFFAIFDDFRKCNKNTDQYTFPAVSYLGFL